MDSQKHIKRKRRILTICLGIALVFVMFLSTYHYRFHIAKWVVAEGVKRYNLPTVEFTFQQLDLQRTHIRDIHFGNDLQISSLALDYSFSNLWAKNINRLSIEGVQIDLSSPESGTIGQLRKLIPTDKQSGPEGLSLPEIIITDTSIYAKQENFSSNIHLDARITPDGSGTFQIAGQAETQGANVADVELDGTISKNLTSVSFNLKKALVTHASISPLTITGNSELAAPKIIYSFKISDVPKNISAILSGTTNLNSLKTKARLNVDEITFKPEGVQPSDFSPLVKSPVPIDARIAATADISIENGVPVINSEIHLRKIRFPTLPAQQKNVHMTGQAQVQFTPLDKQGKITIPYLDIKDASSSPLFHPLRLTASTSYDVDQLTFTSAISLQEAASTPLISATGKHDLNLNEGHAEIKSSNLDFSPQRLKPVDLSPLFSVITEMTGLISMRSSVKWKDNQLVSQNGQLNLTDINLKTDTVSAKKLNTQLQLSNLWPPQTKGPQQLTLNELFSGLSLKQPELHFTIDKQTVKINTFKSGLIGGEISLDDFLIDPRARKHDLTLNMSSLDLEELFKLLQLDGVTGTGQLTGNIPLTLVNNDIVISNAVLESDKPGILQFRSEKAKQALGGAGEQVDLLLRVLSNFNYEKLSLKINRALSHNAMLNLRLKGKNPQVMNARPFNLNINLEGNIDKILSVILEGYRLSDRAIRSTVNEGQ